MFMPKLRTGTAPSYSACGWSQQVARLQSGAKKETLTSAWEEVQGGIAKGRVGYTLKFREAETNGKTEGLVSTESLRGSQFSLSVARHHFL